MNRSLTASATISKLTSFRPGVVSLGMFITLSMSVVPWTDLFERGAIYSAASGVVSWGKNLASVEFFAVSGDLLQVWFLTYVERGAHWIWVCFAEGWCAHIVHVGEWYWSVEAIVIVSEANLSWEESLVRDVKYHYNLQVLALPSRRLLFRSRYSHLIRTSFTVPTTGSLLPQPWFL